MRKRSADAEGKVEHSAPSRTCWRRHNTTLTNQGMAELNTQLRRRGRARRFRGPGPMARDLLKSGKPIDSLDVLNSENIRRLAKQRNAIRAATRRAVSTLLDGHPRIKELRAQIADLDRAMQHEVGRIVHGIENDARIARRLADKLAANLDVLKRQTA